MPSKTMDPCNGVRPRPVMLVIQLVLTYGDYLVHQRVSKLLQYHYHLTLIPNSFPFLKSQVLPTYNYKQILRRCILMKTEMPMQREPEKEAPDKLISALKLILLNVVAVAVKKKNLYYGACCVFAHVVM